MKIFLVECTDWNEDVPVWVDSVHTSPVKAQRRVAKILKMGLPDRRAIVNMMKVDK